MHIGQGVTPEEYLFQVLLFLLAFTGVGITTFGGVRVMRLLNSGISVRGRIDDDEP